MEYNAKQLQIIQVAERLFAGKGFSGTSIRDIAHEADINVSMISYYFGSKEKLIEALFEVRIVESAERMENIVSNEDLSPLQKIYILIDGVIDRLLGNQCFHNIMLREQLSGEERTPVISDLIYELKLKNWEGINSILREGQAKEHFRDNVDVALLSATLYGTVNHFLTTQSFYRKINNLESLGQEEFDKSLKQKLSKHLKSIFKATVAYETIE
ncbi:TetR/AcrR family transcriptional regulator [Dyadobacter frigoris]|uniref:TetR/AcrR family transcriptional regulator n=1 Tax=Dyadobacter frigoris TaxID=2576211 RepID=A0A4U6D4Z8_9BACT|nr:TetR family transcriptional regulator [Dyadobacter frigoris]TKT92409.1 TetR/AcrR family transcriptional regulator [Dyadobacter frigoris]GLU53600.1 TetR family transcriptional regulator [Dyadobacter frigoris]